jgi:hypothetical protein
VKWRKWHVGLAAAAAIAGGVALTRGGGDRASEADAGVVVEPPVPAPDGLLCDLYVAAPNAVWTKLQRGVGGAAGILPATLPGVLILLADLEVTLANELDGTAPMYGAAAGDPADFGLVLAMKLVDPRRARSMLVGDGDAGRFVAREEAGMTVLVPMSSRSTDRRFEVAITKNGYLLLGRRSADLQRLGPYVTRTLPSRTLPAEAAVLEVPRSALQALLKPRLEGAWKEGRSFLLAQDERMRLERGRAPDFADPAAIVAALDAMLARRIAIVGDLERVRIALDVAEDAAVLTATLAPTSDPASEAKKWIDTMKVGDASPLLELPAVSTLALSTRDSEAERAEQASALEKAVASSLGPRLKEPEKLREVFDAITKSRDEAIALAVGLEEPAGLFLRARVRDGDAANKAIRGGFELAKIAPFKEMLRAKNVTSSREELPGLGTADVLTLLRDPPMDHKPPPVLFRSAQDAGPPRASGAPIGSLGVAWLISEGKLSLGAGAEPAVTLKIGARTDKKLADEPSLARFLSAIGNDASTIVVGQPLRLDPKRASLPTSPLAIAVGKKGGDAFVRVEVSAGLLREAARWHMGF